MPKEITTEEKLDKLVKAMEKHEDFPILYDKLNEIERDKKAYASKTLADYKKGLVEKIEEQKMELPEVMYDDGLKMAISIINNEHE